ncbi:unnamed protein product [Lathyrus sativus]|nr:unnamed protein product [Lathyrus sativus]
MDKKKSKLVGIVEDEGKEVQNKKEIHIVRTDEFGRILTPKEAFRIISHKFHGKKAYEAISRRVEIEANEEFRYIIIVCGENEGSSSSYEDTLSCSQRPC